MPRAPGQDALPLGSLLLELTTIFDLPCSIAGRFSSCGIRLPESEGAGAIALSSRAQSSTMTKVASSAILRHSAKLAGFVRSVGPLSRACSKMNCYPD